MGKATVVSFLIGGVIGYYVWAHKRKTGSMA